MTMDVTGAQHEEREDVVLDTISGEDAERQLSALLDQAFSVPPGRHFFDDFPVWSEELAPSGRSLVRLGAFEHPRAGGAGPARLVASTGIRLAYLKSPEGGSKLKVGLIGAVATHPDFRGNGLASELVRYAVEWAKIEGAMAVFLWGSEHSLYRRQGFELCGVQAMAALGELDLPGDSSIQPMEHGPVERGWNPAIFKTMMLRQGGLAHQVSDLPWLEAHRGVRWFWTGPAEQPSAYVGLDRGIDLQGLIHEWGGKQENLRGLLSWLKANEPGASVLGDPAALAQLGARRLPVRQEFLCLARILDPAGVFSAFHPLVPIHCRKSGEGASELYYLSVGSSPEQLLTGPEVCRLFFGPAPEGMRASHLPLPLWFWGLDAV